MKNPKSLGHQIFFPLVGFALFSGLFFPPFAFGQQILTGGSENAPVPATSAPASQAATETDLLAASFQAFKQGTLDVALEKVNQVIALDTQNKQAHMLRASIYAAQKEWEKADYDYQVALTIDPAFTTAKFDMAELKFMQKKYDEARAGFLELKADKDLSDFVSYKAFLCSLFAGHEDVAARDLDAFNEAGGNPPYYFGNAAWDLVHHKTSEAADWLQSASRIYANSPQKFATYTRSLTNLGYLPIQPSTVSAQ